MSQSTNDGISNAAQLGTNKIHRVWTCEGVAAIAMIVVAYAEHIAASNISLH
jgi:hypothetical protein